MCLVCHRWNEAICSYASFTGERNWRGSAGDDDQNHTNWRSEACEKSSSWRNISAIFRDIPTLVYADDIGKYANWVNEVLEVIKVQKIEKGEVLNEKKLRLAPLQDFEDVYRKDARVE